MKVQNRAHASQNNALFVSQGSRARGLVVRPCPHSNGLKRSVPPHCVTSSRNKTVWALRFVLGNEPSQPQPRGRGTKRKAHTVLLRELVTQWGGTAGFNPLLCGQGRSINALAVLHRSFSEWISVCQYKFQSPSLTIHLFSG